MRVTLKAMLEFKAGEAPTEVLILPFGVTETSHGPFELTQEGAEGLITRWTERGRDFEWDYEHQTFAYPPIEAPASGWAKLELRDDGIWAVDIRWTEKATAYLKAGEYRFWSPVLELDGSKIVDMYNCALTNFPATFSQTPLMPFSEHGRIAPSLAEAPPEARDALKALLKAAFGEIADLVNQALERMVGRWVWVEALYEDAVVYRMDGRFYQVGYVLKATQVYFQGAPIEVERIWSPIEVDESEEGSEALAEAGQDPQVESLKETGEEKIAALREENERLKATQLFKDSKSKIPPTMRDVCWELARACPALFTQLVDSFPSFLPPQTKRQAPEGGGQIEFTEAELAVFKQTGVNPDDVRKKRQSKEM